MRGGVVSKIDDEPLDDQTYRILSESKIEYLSRGSYGFVFKVTYTGKKDSGFVDENGIEVRVFILKVQGIDMRMKRTQDPEPIKHESEYMEKDNKDGLFPYSKKIDWDEVVNEVTLQQQIYKCALENDLMPPCPSILYYGSITAEQFETYKRGYFVYNEHGKIIFPRDYKSLRLAIILMEYVDAKDITEIPDEIYAPKDQEIRNKAFRCYVTAIKCGVLQNDPNPQNFLISEDDNVTLIDFGEAQKLTPTETRQLLPLIKDAENETGNKHRNCMPLIKKLLSMEHDDPDYKILEKWLLRPQLSMTGKWLGPTLTTLDPEIPLPEDKAKRCKSGICHITKSNLPGRKRISEETEQEYKRQKEEEERKKRQDDAMKRYEMELARRAEDKAAEENEASKRKPSFFSNFWGGKRHTKYVGTRKKTRTRRKV